MIFIDNQTQRPWSQSLKRLQEFDQVVLLGRCESLERHARSRGLAVVTEGDYFTHVVNVP